MTYNIKKLKDMDYNNSSGRFRPWGSRHTGGYWFRQFRGSRTGFYGPETVCPEKIVLKIRSIVIRTANNLFRKVHNYTHFKGDLLGFNESAIFWRFFIIFNLNVSVRWKNGKFQSRKSSTGTSISVKSLIPR